MSTVIGTWTRVIVDHATARGLDAEPLLARAELTAEALARPDVRVPASVDDRVWASLADELGDPDLGVHLSVSTGSFGIVGYVARACATVGEALRVAERFHRLIKDDSRVILRSDERGAIVSEGPAQSGPPWPRPVAEVVLANYLTLVRAWTGIHVEPRCVRFAHARPRSVAELERFFGCPIRFDAGEHALELSRATLALPLTTGDPALLAYLEASAARAIGELGAPGLAAEIRAALGDKLDGEPPSLARIARRLGTSTRSLQRRLHAADLSFRGLVDDQRRAAAISLLRVGVPTGETAARVGFSDARALRRALHRWTVNGARPR